MGFVGLVVVPVSVIAPALVQGGITPVKVPAGPVDPVYPLFPALPV